MVSVAKVYITKLISNAVVHAGKVIPSRSMKNMLAGCPPEAEGVMAEKKTSAAPYTVPCRFALWYPSVRQMCTSAYPSNQM